MMLKGRGFEEGECWRRWLKGEVRDIEGEVDGLCGACEVTLMVFKVIVDEPEIREADLGGKVLLHVYSMFWKLLVH
jgi:hypothetical protein